MFDNLTSYRELFAGFTSQFHELAPGTEVAEFRTDPATAYPAGQVLAPDVLDSDGNGVLYPPSRRPDGQCLVALRPHLVQNIRQGAAWDFVWDGEPTPIMTKR